MTSKLVPAKPGGPPKRKPKDGERVALSLRMTPALKRRLDAAAERGGRSLSQEAEVRLERSFDREDLLSEGLTLAFGDRLAGLLIMLGMAMAGAAAVAPPDQGRRRLFHDDWWASDPDCYETAAFAAKILLDSGRPKGCVTATYNEALALQVVEALVGAVNAKKRGDHDRRHEDVLGRGPLTDAMVRLTGPIATRMGESLPKMRDRRRPSADDHPDVTPIQVEEIKKRLEVKRFVIRGPRALGRPFAQQNPLELGIAVCEASGELQALVRQAKSSRLDVLEVGAVEKILQRHLENYLRPDWRVSEFELGIAVCEASRELGKSSNLNARTIIKILQRHLKDYLRPDWQEWGATYDRHTSSEQELEPEPDVDLDTHKERRH